jgi:hypothetical protein
MDRPCPTPTAELRAARELLARTDETYSCDTTLTTGPAQAFPWLRAMTDEDLEAHIDRLERDLAAASAGSWTGHREAADTAVGADATQATLDSFAEE